MAIIPKEITTDIFLLATASTNMRAPFGALYCTPASEACDVTRADLGDWLRDRDPTALDSQARCISAWW